MGSTSCGLDIDPTRESSTTLAAGVGGGDLNVTFRSPLGVGFLVSPIASRALEANRSTNRFSKSPNRISSGGSCIYSRNCSGGVAALTLLDLGLRIESLSFSLPLEDEFSFSLSFECFNREKKDFMAALIYRSTFLESCDECLNYTCNVDTDTELPLFQDVFCE